MSPNHPHEKKKAPEKQSWKREVTDLLINMEKQQSPEVRSYSVIFHCMTSVLKVSAKLVNAFDS